MTWDSYVWDFEGRSYSGCVGGSKEGSVPRRPFHGGGTAREEDGPSSRGCSPYSTPSR